MARERERERESMCMCVRERVRGDEERKRDATNDDRYASIWNIHLESGVVVIVEINVHKKKTDKLCFPHAH